MTFSISTFSGHRVVRAAGELDIGTAPELRRLINEALDEGANTLIVDLSAVTFVDSTTLGVLIGTYNRLRDSGGAMGVVCPDEKVRRVLRITGLDKVFALFETTDEAAAALS